MAIVYLDDANPVANATSIAPVAVAATVAEGDHAFICVNFKRPGSATLATPSGWEKIVDEQVGTGTPGAGDGPIALMVFYKQAGAAGSLGTLPTLTLGGTTTNSVIQAGLIVYRGDNGVASVLQHDYTVGSDTTSGTGFSVTGGSNPGIITDDRVLVFGSLTTQSPTFSGTPTITATGVTFGPVLNPWLTSTGTGDDARSFAYRASATAGPASAAPVFAGTLDTASTGGVVFLRLRENVISTKTGGTASAGAMSGAKVTTSATTYTKTGGDASAGALSGAKTTTSAAVVTKTGGWASAGAASGAKVREMPKSGGVAGGSAMSGPEVIAHQKTGGSTVRGAMSGPKLRTHQKAGGSASHGAMSGPDSRILPRSGGFAAPGAMSGARKRKLPASGGAVGTGAMSGAKVVTSATVRTKTGGCVGRCAAVGHRLVTHPAVTVKRGAMVGRGATSGPKTVTHPAVRTKTGGSAAAGAASGLRRTRLPRAGGFAAAGAMSGPSQIVSAAVRTKTGGSVGRCALGGVGTVPAPRTLSVVPARTVRQVEPRTIRVAHIQPLPVVVGGELPRPT